MDDKSHGKKPLRTATNKAKDLYNAYMKNEGTRFIPIINSETEKSKQKNSDEILNEEQSQSQAEYEEAKAFIENLIEDFESKIEELGKERDDLKDFLARRTAEFENYKRRSDKEKQDIIQYANERLINKLLVILDDLGNAVESGKKSNDYEALMTGIDMIWQKTSKLFEEAGVKVINVVPGDEFDVDCHEALLLMPSDYPEGTIAQVIQQGYAIHDRVLRHAKVITSSGNSEN